MNSELPACSACKGEGICDQCVGAGCEVCDNLGLCRTCRGNGECRPGAGGLARPSITIVQWAQPFSCVHPVRRDFIVTENKIPSMVTASSPWWLWRGKWVAGPFSDGVVLVLPNFPPALHPPLILEILTRLDQ